MTNETNASNQGAPKQPNPQLIIDNLCNSIAELERENAILKAVLQENHAAQMETDQGGVEDERNSANQ